VHRHAVQIEGTIVEAYPNQTFRVQLANGHRLLAYLPRRARAAAARLRLAAGDPVTVDVSPGDFSTGRLRLHLNGS